MDSALFAPHFTLEHLLGEGGMGRVYAARRADGQRVAIKMLLPELARNAELVHRFLREARSASRIQSEHVARVFEVAPLADGTPYIVMEYLEGSDLSAVLERSGPIPYRRVVDIVLEACEAIAEAHRDGVIHRDLKPSNLFVAQVNGQECVKVLDFGISKSIADGHVSLAMTKTSALLGSPNYMSPEQLVSAKDLDVRTDIWSLGVVLYQLVAGYLPYDADTLPELSVLILGGQRPPRPAHTPPGLVAIIDTCLTKDRTKRFANLADFADAVAPFGTERARASADRVIACLGLPPVRARIASVPELDVTLPLLGTSSAVRPSPALLKELPTASGLSVIASVPQRRSPLLVPIVAAVLALIGITGGVLIFLARTHARPASAAPVAIADPPAPPVSAAASLSPALSPPPPPPPPSAALAAPLPRPVPVATPAKRPAPAPSATPKPKPKDNLFDGEN